MFIYVSLYIYIYTVRVCCSDRIFPDTSTVHVHPSEAAHSAWHAQAAVQRPPPSSAKSIPKNACC